MFQENLNQNHLSSNNSADLKSQQNQRYHDPRANRISSISNNQEENADQYNLQQLANEPLSRALNQQQKDPYRTVEERNAEEEDEEGQDDGEYGNKIILRNDTQKNSQTQSLEGKISALNKNNTNFRSQAALDLQTQTMGSNNNRKRILSAKRPIYYQTQQLKEGGDQRQALKLIDNIIRDDMIAQYSSNKTLLQLRQALQSAKNNQRFPLEMKNAAKKHSTKKFQFFEKEQLHEECLHLKTQVNDIKEYNIVLRNQKQFLQNELSKRDKIIENMNQALTYQQPISGGSPTRSVFKVSPNLVINLKRQVNELQQKVEQKELELDFIKKKMKITKINELEVELEETKLTFQRYKQLSQLQVQALTQKQFQDQEGQQQQPQQTSSSKKLNRVMSAHDRYSSLQQIPQLPNQSEALVKANSELAVQIKRQQDQIKQLKQQVDTLTKLSNQRKVENDNLKKSHSEQMDNTRKLIETLNTKQKQSNQEVAPTNKDSQKIESMQIIIDQLRKENETLKATSALSKQEEKSKVNLNNDDKSKKQIKDLNDQISKLKLHNDTTKEQSDTKIKQLDGIIKKHESENKELKTQNHQLQAELTKKDQTISELDNKLKIASQHVKDLQKDIGKVKTNETAQNHKQVSFKEEQDKFPEPVKHDFKSKNSNDKPTKEEVKQETKEQPKPQKELRTLFTVMSNQDEEQDEDYNYQNIDKRKSDSDDDDNFKADQNDKNAEEGILKIAHLLMLKDYDLRDVFVEFLYDETVDGKEFELISIREFSDLVKEYFMLEEKQIQAISVMLSDHFIGEAFDFKFFEEIFKQMGIGKNKINLDNKSTRILNRLNKYLKENQSDLKKLLAGDIFSQTVRVKGKPDLQIQLCKTQKFFNILQDVGVRKSSDIYENLLQNVQLHKNVRDSIVIDKLIKYLDEVESTFVLKNVGIIKRAKTYGVADLKTNGGNMQKMMTLKNTDNEKLSSIKSEDISDDYEKDGFQEEFINEEEDHHEVMKVSDDEGKKKGKTTDKNNLKQGKTQTGIQYNLAGSGQNLKSSKTLKSNGPSQRM